MRRLIAFILVLIALAAPAWPYNVAVLEYSVSDSPADNRDITVTPSFPIHAAIIKCNAASSAVIAVSGMGADVSTFLSGTGASTANEIQSLGTGTVQVGTGTRVQPDCGTSCTTTCWLVAFGDDGKGDFAYGVYTGNSTDNRTDAFTLTFQPDMGLIACYAGTCSSTGAAFRTSAHSGDSSSRLAAATDLSDLIQSFHATGANLGANVVVNTTGQSYAYLMFKLLPGYNLGDSHVGNTSDDIDIPAIANPIFALAKANSATATGCGRWASTGDVSWMLNNVASAANRFQAFTSTGFQRGTGTCISEDTVTTRWWVTKQPIYTPKIRVINTTD